MSAPRTGGERYLADRERDPAFREVVERASRQVRMVDELVRAIDATRVQAGLSKAELARRADMRPEAVRRLFSLREPNPTITTLAAMAAALDLEIQARAVRTCGRVGTDP